MYQQEQDCSKTAARTNCSDKAAAAAHLKVLVNAFNRVEVALHLARHLRAKLQELRQVQRVREAEACKARVNGPAHSQQAGAREHEKADEVEANGEPRGSCALSQEHERIGLDAVVGLPTEEGRLVVGANRGDAADGLGEPCRKVASASDRERVSTHR